MGSSQSVDASGPRVSQSGAAAVVVEEEPVVNGVVVSSSLLQALDENRRLGGGENDSGASKADIAAIVQEAELEAYRRGASDMESKMASELEAARAGVVGGDSDGTGVVETVTVTHVGSTVSASEVESMADELLKKSYVAPSGELGCGDAREAVASCYRAHGGLSVTECSKVVAEFTKCADGVKREFLDKAKASQQ